MIINVLDVSYLLMPKPLQRLLKQRDSDRERTAAPVTGALAQSAVWLGKPSS